MDREKSIEFYVAKAEARRKHFNQHLKDKGLVKGMLVLRYDNRFDTRKDKKFLQRWEGTYVILKPYPNGSYKIYDVNGRIHKTRVNGWRLKPYFQRFDAGVDWMAPPGTSSPAVQGVAYDMNAISLWGEG